MRDMLRRLAPIVLLLGAAPSARAAGLQVNPVLVELSAAEPRTVVVVKNVADAPVRLELTASAWDQTANGQARFAPAPDLVIYPPLLQLLPQEERKVRVSTTARFGPTEQSYRLFVRELPPAESPVERNSVRILTKISIPVFLMAAKPVLKAEITGAAVHGGRIAFTVKNVGTTRLSPSTMKLQGLGVDGSTVFSKEEALWYVLVRGERALDVALPAEGCARARAVVVEVPVGDVSVRARVETPGGACGP